jgi:2-oxoglutarate dehydrogenase E2 component (dihydrolipoamide succinyltransferase)
MALIDVTVPQLSESVAEATLLAWHKKVGEAVARDENLTDIETDKVVLELPAPAAGVLIEVLKGDGATVVAGEVIGRIDPNASAAASAGASANLTTAEPRAPTVSATAVVSAKSHADVAMPAAAKMLAEAGLTAQQVAGSGRDGRVTKADVTGAIKQPLPATPASSPASIPTGVTSSVLPEVKAPFDIAGLLEGRPEQRVPMSRLRARIAERLLQSQATNAILTTFNEVNMQPVMDLRKKYIDRFEKEHGVRLGFMSFFIKAAVAALKKYPVLNASIDGNDIVYHGYFDIGIAVGSPRGLVVPIIRNADQLSFAQIEKTIADFGKRAGEGKLSLDEMTGGTFSISNGGVFGSMLSTPIINPPQSAILGVHATKDRPVVENGQIVIRPINYLAMSYDHRIIDGREAVLGLVAMKEALEDPARLLLDL